VFPKTQSAFAVSEGRAAIFSVRLFVPRG